MYRLTIKEVLQERNISIEEFAKRRGVTKVSAYRYMNTPNISLDKLQEIADAIGCSIKDLFVEDNEEVKPSNMFLWDNDRERQLRLLVRSYESVVSDMQALHDQAKELLKDSDL